MRLEEKVALITGATGGIGSAISKRFACEGAKVVVTELDEGLGAKLVEEITSAGGTALFHALDVTSEDEWARAIGEAVARFNQLDILVNNAGVFQRKDLIDITVDEWDLVLDTKAKGTFLGSKLAIPIMRDGGGGAIVNLSSISGIRGASGSAHYGASKGAVRLLTKAIARRYARDDIRCNSLHPGPIETDMGYAAWPESERASRLEQMPMCRYGTPDEIANAALFLASDEASYMTGSEMIVDGGTTA